MLMYALNNSWRAKSALQTWQVLTITLKHTRTRTHTHTHTHTNIQDDNLSYAFEPKDSDEPL